MIVDGKAIALNIFSDLEERILMMPTKPRLAVLTADPNFETQKFLSIKKRMAEKIGIHVTVHTLSKDISQVACVAEIEKTKEESHGIVIQLPFPQQIDAEALINAIPPTHDVDAFVIEDQEVLPPVAGAMKEILIDSNINIHGRSVVVVGNGRLVGAPAARWFAEEGALVDVVTKDTPSIQTHTIKADIVVLGAGKPGLLQPYMIQEGVIILDAGTSEEGGELKGDADFRCGEKASLFTPVPGGVGPVTVAVLLRNLVILASRKHML